MRSFGLFVVAVLAAVVFAFPATAAPPSLVGTINGGGTANMDPDSFAQGTTAFGIHATLYSDGTAKGHIMCTDQAGDSDPGNIFGEVTGWEEHNGLITLHVEGKFVGFPNGSPPGGHPEDVQFSVTIQEFGGAGVGHWTLAVTVAPNVEFVFCRETLTSGQLVMRD